jgi:hypothetical protein
VFRDYHVCSVLAAVVFVGVMRENSKWGAD